METGTENAGHKVNASFCSIQVTYWTCLGPQAVAPIVFLIDQYNSERTMAFILFIGLVTRRPAFLGAIHVLIYLLMSLECM